MPQFDSENSNFSEILKAYAHKIAKIQKFYDSMDSHLKDLNEQLIKYDKDEHMKEHLSSIKHVLFSYMDEFQDIFEDTLA